jgi:hypothetical protein
VAWVRRRAEARATPGPAGEASGQKPRNMLRSSRDRDPSATPMGPVCHWPRQRPEERRHLDQAAWKPSGDPQAVTGIRACKLRSLGSPRLCLSAREWVP